MNINAAIEELLRACWSDKAIARHLHVHRNRPRDRRRALGLPTHKGGPTPAASIEDLFWRRTQPTDDGHLLIPNYDPHRGATVRRGDRRYSIHRVAFRIAHNREPEGRVATGCGVTGCVHPNHVEDRPMRDAYTAIFGAAA